MKIQSKTLKKIPFLAALLVLASLPLQALIINMAANEDVNQANAFEALTISPNQGSIAGGTDVTISGLGFDDTVDIVKVAVGSIHSLALDSNGKVYAWGYGADGQLGNGDTINQVSPVAVDTSGVLAGKTITAITASGGQHSLALDSNGKVYAWGDNTVGQLGSGTITSDQSSPVAVDTSGVLNGKTIVAISAAGGHSLALDSDGKVYSWGYDSNGQLGDGGTNTNQSSPVAVDTSGVLAGKTIVAISAGSAYSLALDSDGKVYAWGNGGDGQLGYGDVMHQASPVAVDTSGVLNGKTVKVIAAGGGHSLAIDSDGKVYAWGSDTTGQLGTGTTTSGIQPSPVAVDISGVLAGKTITAIAPAGSAGGGFSLALDSDGKVYAWGMDNRGQLGDGANAGSNVPVVVDTSGALAGKTITAIAAAGAGHSLALDSSGKVYSWGNDELGQLGNGAVTGDQVSPVAVDTNPATSALGYVPGPISVTFDPTGTAAECTNVVLVDENTITCTTSAHIAGTVDVLVSDTVRNSTLRQSFTYKDITPEVPDTGAK